MRLFIGEGGEGLTIKNLTLEGTFTGVNHAGGFVGRAGGAATFINCTNNIDITGTNNIGGFVGWTSSAMTITNCINNGDITATSEDTDNYAGGFIGQANVKTANITNGVNYGSISGKKGFVAGIARQGSVTNSLSIGTVTNTNGKAAPIVDDWSGTVTNTYYLEGNATGTTAMSTTIGVSKTAGEFASGEVAYLLNGSSSENIVWGQKLGTDPYPVLGDTENIVYKVQGGYNNSGKVMGTEENPYLIETEADLIAFRDAVSADAAENEGSTLCAKLIAEFLERV